MLAGCYLRMFFLRSGHRLCVFLLIEKEKQARATEDSKVTKRKKTAVKKLYKVWPPADY